MFEPLKDGEFVYFRPVAQKRCHYKTDTERRKNFSRVAPSSIFGTHLGEKECPEG
ncbi:MAG: hypothetical protein A4E65_01784 [Syntrophorhabdus sp. PtaU1.Bin153]|nr:MAG: hypothetical protein A4E65_01784 [Syntrophorhabdus sp. PtaU1.Bin153]